MLGSPREVSPLPSSTPPRPITETLRPSLPSVRYSIRQQPGRLFGMVGGRGSASRRLLRNARGSAGMVAACVVLAAATAGLVAPARGARASSHGRAVYAGLGT